MLARALDTLLEPHTMYRYWGQVCPTHTKTSPKELSRSIRFARPATCPCGLWSIVLPDPPMRRHDRFSSAKFVVQELCCRRLQISRFCENVLGARWSAYGPKPTWAGALQMSAFGGKADMTVWGISFRGRYWGQSGRALLHCICPLMTQSGSLFISPCNHS
jgi:hypothetical protein